MKDETEWTQTSTEVWLEACGTSHVRGHSSRIVLIISKLMEDPNHIHWKTVERILRYIQEQNHMDCFTQVRVRVTIGWWVTPRVTSAEV